MDGLLLLQIDLSVFFAFSCVPTIKLYLVLTGVEELFLALLIAEHEFDLNFQDLLARAGTVTSGLLRETSIGGVAGSDTKGTNIFFHDIIY